MKSNQITEVPAEQKGWIRVGQRKLVNQEGRSSILFQHKQYRQCKEMPDPEPNLLTINLFNFTFPPNLKE
jgi:hypothetical protein